MDSGQVKGEVVDVGCGTGEHSILMSDRGHRTLGVDSAPLAIEKAKAKARARRSKAEFRVGDALDLPSLGRTFDTAIDCGVFHVFTDPQRAVYVRSLRGVIKPGGKYFTLVFSDREPADWGGPRRISKEEILRSFSTGWKVDYIKAESFESAFHSDGGHAWLAGITRVDDR